MHMSLKLQLNLSGVDPFLDNTDLKTNQHNGKRLSLAVLDYYPQKLVYVKIQMC